jgi:hypothetical protein
MSREACVAALQRFEYDYRSLVTPAGKTWARAASLFALASAPFVGCSSQECNSMTCPPPHVEISFDPVISEAGHYRFELDADGQRSTCEVDFRLDGGFTGASACGALLLRGGLSRDYATEIVGYTLPQATSVSIAVFRGDELWVEHSFTPRYRDVEVNGEGCGGCTVATEALALP